MISKEEVLKIAKLARLELAEYEVEKMQKDMSVILDYFDVLKKAPQNNAKSHAEKRVKNLLRKDEVSQKNSILAGDLVNAAPDKKENYIKVKQIL